MNAQADSEIFPDLSISLKFIDFKARKILAYLCRVYKNTDE